jgi:hypothetical protein
VEFDLPDSDPFYTLKCGNLISCEDNHFLDVNCQLGDIIVVTTGTHKVRFLTEEHDAPGTSTDEDDCQPELQLPRPRFVMSSSSQQSEGGTLTISAGHSISLQATTTDFGYPAATVNDHDWSLDGTQLGTGASTSTVPGYGSHTVHLTLANSTGQGEATATIIVVAPDEEAGACDDPLTDVVEVECDGPSNNGPYAVGGTVSGGGTRWCLVNQWYDWNEATQRYEYWYTEELYCWYEE